MRKRATLRGTLDLISFAVVGVALVFVAVRVIAQHTVRSIASNEEVMSPAKFMALRTNGHWLGPRNAPVVVVVYSTYTCGFCGELHTNLSKLRSRYPQHLAVVMKHFVDPQTLIDYKVPLGAECAGDLGQFEQYNAAAFEHRKFLTYSDGWLNLAVAAGVSDIEAFKSCVAVGEFSSKVQGHYREAGELGVRVTPTMFINGVGVIGSPSLHALDSIVAGQFYGRKK
jgi:protein-disulfide isomerase